MKRYRLRVSRQGWTCIHYTWALIRTWPFSIKKFHLEKFAKDPSFCSGLHALTDIHETYLEDKQSVSWWLEASPFDPPWPLTLVCTVRALLMQDKNTSSIPCRCGSNSVLAAARSLLGFGRMLKSRGGNMGTDSKLAKVAGGISGRTRRNKAVTWNIQCLDIKEGAVSFTYCGLVMPYGIKIRIDNGSGNGLLPDGTKPLLEPVLTYHQRCFEALYYDQFYKKCSRYRFTKCVWKPPKK